MASFALVGLNSFFSSLNLPKDGLSGLLKNVYIIYVLTLLFSVKKIGIFKHFKCFLAKRHILKYIYQQAMKYIKYTLFWHFRRIKLPYLHSNYGLMKTRYLIVSMALI